MSKPSSSKSPKHHRGKPPGTVWRPDLAFHAGLTAAWAAIGVLWIITPLCYLYVLWTLITLAPSLKSARPATHGALRVLHYIVLAYSAVEIPFSVYYRFLAFQAQARRPSPQYTRKFLRDVLRRSLANGMTPDEAEEEAEEDVMDALTLGELTKTTSREEAHGMYNMRNRSKSSWGGISAAQEGPGTPDLSTVPTHTLDREGVRGASNGGIPGSASLESVDSKKYLPSFIDEPLEKEDPRAADFRNFLRMWFHNCKYDDIGKLNMSDWLAWSLYGQPYEEVVREREKWEKDGRPVLHLDGEPDEDEDGLAIDGDKLGLVEHCVDMVEARSGRTFPPGRNPNVKTIRLTLDPVRVMSRPFILYGFVYCLQKAVIGNAKRHGFKELSEGGLTYLVRIPQGWTPDRNCPEANRPLLFLHGLGMGMPQYATLLNYLSTSKTLKDRPILVLLQPNISMAFFKSGYLDPLEKNSTAAGLKRIAEKHLFDKSGMTVLSHSNGTMVHGWLLKAYPELCFRNCFVDPVCFCLWEPYVAFNFLYSKPVTPIEYLMRYFVSRELGVAIMLQRSFDWSANLLFPHTIPNLESPYHSAFFLAGCDSILNADRIRTYLKRHGVKEVKATEGVGELQGGLKLHPLNSHGQSMIGTGEPFDMIMSWVTRDQADGDMVSGNSSDAV